MLPLSHDAEKRRGSCHNERKPLDSGHSDLLFAFCLASSFVGDSVGDLDSFPEFGESSCSNSQTYMLF